MTDDYEASLPKWQLRRNRIVAVMQRLGARGTPEEIRACLDEAEIAPPITERWNVGRTIARAQRKLKQSK